MSIKPKIYLSSPHMSGDEQHFIQEAFMTNWIAPLGSNLNGFEEDIQKYNDVNHCAALSSGTAAIHLALILLGVCADDEVLCSTLTFSATVNPILYQKAKPVFIDSEADTWNMCPTQLREAINHRLKKGKKPKACIIVHLYGMPAKIEELCSICDEYDIPVIEDAAEAIGSSFKNKKMGTFGEIGIFSFNGNKIITTSGGGALVSNNSEIVEKARFLATQARDPAPHYQHSHIGYNYRLSNILAGIGRGQMMVLDKWIERRRDINKWYRALFQPFDFINLLTEPSEDYFSNHWLSCIIVSKNSLGISKETIRLKLAEDNIESRPLWKPMHQQPIFKNYPKYINGTSDDMFEKGLCLPSGSNMTENQFNRIGDTIMKLLNISHYENSSMCPN